MAENNPLIRRGETCVVITGTTPHQGTVMNVTASTVQVQVNGVAYRFSRAHARSTVLQRLVIEVAPCNESK